MPNYVELYHNIDMRSMRVLDQLVIPGRALRSLPVDGPGPITEP